MSKFFSKKYASLTPYTPGEQPRDLQYIKLNTNESPYAPPASVVEVVKREAEKCNLYSDPTCRELVEEASKSYKVKPSCILPTNGSDEILNFAFMAFCDQETPAVFADVTYGFYEVFARLHSIPYRCIPLKEDFSIDYRDYLGVNATIFIANPNAPTGLAIKREQIEEILRANPNNVVVIDEAYVDFGGESCVPLVDKYENLLVTQTFSKSRSLAGARLGFGFACEKLINDLNTIKYSTNPYNVNRMTMSAGVVALREQAYFDEKCAEICKTRAYTKEKLESLGFSVLDSKTNFLFVRSEKIAGETLYKKLKENGILVRHFSGARICEFNRVTIGTREQMDTFLSAVEKICKE